MIFSGIFFGFAFKIASSAIILVYAFIILQFARKRSQNMNNCRRTSKLIKTK